jgi:hypothetical protein
VKGANIRVASPLGEGWERALLGALLRGRRLDSKDAELLLRA